MTFWENRRCPDCGWLLAHDIWCTWAAVQRAIAEQEENK